MINVLEVKNDSLETIVKNSKVPVFVDMYADWCGPCKMIAPIVEELAKEYGDKIDFVKVNVDENPLTGAIYKVRSIPTLMVFNNGELIKQKSGAMPKSQIVELFKDQII